MAPRTRIVKIGALLLSQFGLLAALNFQLFWMVTAYKMMELKRKEGFSARAELRPGLNPALCNRQFDFNRICRFRSRFLSGLKLQPGLKFAM